MSATVYVIGTMDTKGAELRYATEVIARCGARPLLVDVGTAGTPDGPADVARETVAAFHPQGMAAVLGLSDRGAAVTRMGEALECFLQAELAGGKVAAVFGMGGTGGTALISAAFRALPVGLPKLLVSTVASGNTAPYVGTSDLALANSVVDIAGLNRVSRRILANAAAVSGMALHPPHAADEGGRSAGMTMFGVTTPCVNAVRKELEAHGWECMVFHATGAGGRAMEAQAISDACRAERADVIVLCHGGPIASPEDAAYVLERTREVHGFYGASSMERLPTEIAITEQVRKFCAIRRSGRDQ